ncbi:MAG: hypothetical protein HZB17_02515 [Chloroflexi bacterium]|nr:hypothetical protein [Chloroflexota bacterium]
MSQLSIVDTQKLSWKQIYEVRKDTKSWERLKRFRLFFHENYSDKDIHFIEDDLQTRIADYHLACKEHGFETINGVFQKVTSSQTLIGATGTGVGAIVSHQLGLPLTIPLAAISATAIALELGSILLEVAKGKLSLGKLKETHEVAYIVDLKKRVKSK